MISKSLLMLKVQLINQFNPRKAKENKMIIVAYAILIFIVVTYSAGFAFILAGTGMGYTIPTFALLLGSFLSLLFTLFKTNSVIFASKDYDRLMSLPIKESQLIASRFLSIYVINSLFIVGIMLPMAFAHQISCGVTWYGCVCWFLGMVLGSLIPTTLATALGALVTFIASKFRHSKMVSTFLGLILLVGIMALSFGMIGVDESTFDSKHLINLCKSAVEAINKAYPVADWFSRAVNGSIVGVLLFVLVSVAWFMFYVWLLSLRYQRIHTALTAKYSKGNYKMGELQTASPLYSLFRREMKHYSSCSVYLQNTAVGAALAVIAAAAILVIGPSKMLDGMDLAVAYKLIGKVLPFVIAALLGMSCTTSSSLSLEGKSAWILQSLPIRTKDVVISKMLVNLVISIPCSIVSGVLITIAWHKDPVEIVGYFLIPIAYSIFISVWGLVINYKFLRLDWENEVQVVKQSMASMVGMLGGLFMGAGLMEIVILSGFIPYIIVLSVILIILIIVTGSLYYFISTRKSLLER